MAIGGCLGMILLLVIGGVWLMLTFRDGLPPLTKADFSAAIDRWEERGASDYDMEIEIGGQRSGLVVLSVRGGRVTAMTRDGVIPKLPKTWQVWSVDGQFDMIERELEIAADPTAVAGSADGTEHRLGAEFDPHDGHVLRFRRLVIGEGAEFSWAVTRFEPIGQ